MKKIIYLLMLSISLSACNSIKNMTDTEKALINNKDINTPFRVLQTDNSEDSIFLRKKSIEIDITEFTENKDWKHFIERLKVTLTAEAGVGIAAPQVGIGRNLFLFMRIDQPDHKIEVAINPKITAHSDEIFNFEGDGCLSVPEISAITKRYTWIDVEYYNEYGVLVKERLSGESRSSNFTGVIFQHEFDHLQGVLFIDRLTQ